MAGVAHPGTITSNANGHVLAKSRQSRYVMVLRFIALMIVQIAIMRNRNDIDYAFCHFV